MSDHTKASYKLPAEAYFDQSWLDKEKLNIFAGSWLFAGLASELPEPGCYKTLSAGFDELMVVRDTSGNLNAFHNTCRHRGARLVSGEGKCGSFVCPYHKWGYGLDGNLRGIPQREQFEDLNLKELGLHKASVENWMGLLFVHVDENPSVSFEQWSVGLADELAAFKVDELQLLKQESFTFEANWKLYIENHVDWLHLWYVHPQTLGAYDHSDGQVMQFGSSFCSYDPVKPELEAASLEANPLPDIPHLKDVDKRYSEIGAHFLFPNLPIFTGRSFFVLADLIPLAPGKTQMNISLLGLPGGDADAFMTMFNEVTKGEDAAIITAIQKVVRSSRFAVGPIAHTYENAISCFHEHYLNMIDGPSSALRIAVQ
jgi:phenylpropionate dioxygenase-like ring-hydroxylating dioxygenase large terminal subunit